MSEVICICGKPGGLHKHCESKLKIAECYCSATIQLLPGQFTDTGADMWLDSLGGFYCYPGADGADGEARHEPPETV